MKKFLIATISIIVGATGLLTFLQATDLELAVENVSELRYNLFEGSTENVYASLMTGVREDPYRIDGKASPLIDFGVITVNFLDNISGNIGSPLYKLTVDDKVYEGTLERDPFKANYVADIKTVVNNDAQVYFQVNWDEFTQSFKLDNISQDWMVDSTKALEIAIDHIGDKQFKNFVKNGKFLGEVHVKIIGDESSTTNIYFWYVNLYGQNGSLISLVIDPNSGEVIAEKILEY